MPRWSAVYSLGLPDVDKEHRGLFAGLSDLSVAVFSDDWSTAKRILEVIPTDATKHFGREERLMRRAGYSGCGECNDSIDAGDAGLMPHMGGPQETSVVYPTTWNLNSAPRFFCGLRAVCEAVSRAGPV